MKIRTLLIALGLVATLGLAACGSDAPTPAEEQTTTTQEPAAQEKDFDGSQYSDMGAGTMYLTTPAGTSENGNIPFLLIQEDTILDSVGLEAWDFDGSKISYVYFDGMLDRKDQLADTQTFVELTEDRLAAGIHTVEVVQYDNDEEGGTVVTYKVAQFEIKV